MLTSPWEAGELGSWVVSVNPRSEVGELETGEQHTGHSSAARGRPTDHFGPHQNFHDNGLSIFLSHPASYLSILPFVLERALSFVVLLRPLISGNRRQSPPWVSRRSNCAFFTSTRHQSSPSLYNPANRPAAEKSTRTPTTHHGPKTHRPLARRSCAPRAGSPANT